MGGTEKLPPAPKAAPRAVARSSGATIIMARPATLRYVCRKSFQAMVKTRMAGSQTLPGSLQDDVPAA